MFLPVGCSSAHPDANSTRWNQLVLCLPSEIAPPALDDAQRTALNVARRILWRGAMPHPPRFLQLQRDTLLATTWSAEGTRDWKSEDRSAEEERFFNVLAPTIFGPEGMAYLHPQVPAAALAELPHEALGRVDFAFMHPGFEGRALVIEIDGTQHLSPTQAGHDRTRRDIIQLAGHEVIAIPTAEVRAGRGPNLDRCRELLQDEELMGAQADARLAAVHAMAALVELIETGHLDVAAPEWWLAVTGTAPTALETGLRAGCRLLRALENLYATELLAKEVEVVESKDAAGASAVFDWRHDTAWSAPISRPSGATSNAVTMRLAWLPHSIVQPIPTPPANWVQPNPGVSDESLTTLLHSIFPSKEEFWEGQLPALRRCLEGDDTIVLLPTGGGKSLIYQTAAVLLPGLTLVVSPLVALIADQVDNLFREGITRVAQITSATTAAGATDFIQSTLRSGADLMVYISPERLQIKSFRDTLVAVCTAMPIPLIIVDEAHCVSEWGHDFRPAYLNLARAARRFGRRVPGTRPAIIGLTGTASRAVLHDLLHALAIDGHEAVITPTTFDRPELHFEVHNVGSDQKESALEGVLRSIPARLNFPPSAQYMRAGLATKCGIVFCPHVKGPYGVISVAHNLSSRLRMPVPAYAGGEIAPEVRQLNAQQFKDNQAPLLVATKAFGMGIDKPNVRYTVHYGLTESLEAFYQEAGRAGRDRRRAHCVMIASVDDSLGTTDMLSPAVSLAEARSRKEDIRRSEEDDIARGLWFFFQAFQGQNEDYEALTRVISALGQVGVPGAASVQYGDDDEHREVERALHRLHILGVVADYTVNYAAHTIEVTKARCTGSSLRESVHRYVAAYSRLQARRLFPLHADGANEDPKVVLLRLARNYLQFVYDTVAQRRRASIREVAAWATESRSAQELRDRLLGYLQETPFTEAVENIIREAEDTPELWTELLEQPASLMQWTDLDNALVRAYGDFPDSLVVLGLRAVTSLKLGKLPTHTQFAEAFVQRLNMMFADQEAKHLELLLWMIEHLRDSSSPRLETLVALGVQGQLLGYCGTLASRSKDERVHLGLAPRVLELVTSRTKVALAMATGD
jgi:ATP-dependent DNA helicase RecQ